jgi:hypothetical protein
MGRWTSDYGCYLRKFDEEIGRTSSGFGIGYAWASLERNTSFPSKPKSTNDDYMSRRHI